MKLKEISSPFEFLSLSLSVSAVHVGNVKNSALQHVGVVQKMCGSGSYDQQRIQVLIMDH